MKYDINSLPDFFSVRNFKQIDYALEGMENKKCYCFFENGFTSNIIEPNKRDMRFIWDGFILFTDYNIKLEDIKCGINLHNQRLVALQRTNVLGKRFNDNVVKKYIINKLQEKNIFFEIMKDTKNVSGYPSTADLWSTRDQAVLLDAINYVGCKDAYYFKNSDFKFEISFNESGLPNFSYNHKGAIVLRGKNSTAIARLICNDQMLQYYLEYIIGNKIIYSDLQKSYLPGTSINNIEDKLKNK